MKRRVLGILLAISVIITFIPEAIYASIAKSDALPSVTQDAPVVLREGTDEATILERNEVTLITGDVVLVTQGSDGRKGIAVMPTEGKTAQSFLVLDLPAADTQVEAGPAKRKTGSLNTDSSSASTITNTYVIPSGISLAKFDLELFNIDYLIKEEYNKLAYVPVLVTEKAVSSLQDTNILKSQVSAFAEVTNVLPKVSTVAARLHLDTVQASCQSLQTMDNVQKVWLNRRYHVDLAQSMPLIGAPEVWSENYTGAGVKIAILDTGIDISHPDLDDLDDNPATSDPKLIAGVNYTDDPSLADLFGHGTHVAAIAAGTGNAPTGLPSPTHCWTSGVGDNLSNSLENSFDLSGIASADLDFWLSYNTEPYWDYGYLDISTDNGSTWTEMDKYTGMSKGWEEKKYDLTPYAGEQVLLRFRYVTDESNVYPGISVDNIAIPQVGFSDNVECGTGTWTANGWTINPLRYRGVAPGALLYNVKVLNRYGYGYADWVIAGIEYAALGPDGVPGTGDEADIINMSLGSSPTDGTDPFAQVVNWAVSQGVVVVVSAGNYGSYFSVGTPGVATSALTVGASTPSDDMASFSSAGPTLDLRVKPDITAPGYYITSARAAGTSMGQPVNSFYTTASGTSMAAPHVAGAAALFLQANATAPAGMSLPGFVKSSFMSHAQDIDKDIYRQGAGRLNLSIEPPAPTSTIHPRIIITPVTTSFGAVNSADNVTLTRILTFRNTDTVAHNLALSSSLELVPGGFYSDNVTLTPSTLTVPAGGSANATLSVRTSTLPPGLYSGKVTAMVDSITPIHAIFGFSMLRQLTLRTLDMAGLPRGHNVVICSDSPLKPFPSARVLYTDYYTGMVTISVPDGLYHIASISSGEPKVPNIFTLADVMVSGNMMVTLDDRQTVPVNFNPNRPEPQTIAGKIVELFPPNSGGEVYTVSTYPASTTTRISPNKPWHSAYTYQYFPTSSYNAKEPWMVDTPWWADVKYGLGSLSGNITFVADYTNLVTRTSTYKTALKGDMARRVQWAFETGSKFAVGIGWRMLVPAERTELLSPSFDTPPSGAPGWVPVEYSELYEQASEKPVWGFRYASKYPPGQTASLVAGEHPFHSGASVYWDDIKKCFVVSGDISRDTYGDGFYNYTRDWGGHLAVKQNGISIIDTMIHDQFGYSFLASGNPQTEVIIEGWSGQALSSYTRTRFNFIANPAVDFQPPNLWFGLAEFGPDMRNGVAPGSVKLRIGAGDETGIADLKAGFSVDNGVTWQAAPITPDTIVPGTFIADLGNLENTFVSLRFEATDNSTNGSGNAVRQEISDALYVFDRLEIRQPGQSFINLGGAQDLLWTISNPSDTSALNLASGDMANHIDLECQYASGNVTTLWSTTSAGLNLGPRQIQGFHQSWTPAEEGPVKLRLVHRDNSIAGGIGHMGSAEVIGDVILTEPSFSAKITDPAEGVGLDIASISDYLSPDGRWVAFKLDLHNVPETGDSLLLALDVDQNRLTGAAPGMVPETLMGADFIIVAEGEEGNLALLQSPAAPNEDFRFVRSLPYRGITNRSGWFAVPLAVLDGYDGSMDFKAITVRELLPPSPAPPPSPGSTGGTTLEQLLRRITEAITLAEDSPEPLPPEPLPFLDVAPNTPPVSTVPDPNWVQIASDPAGDNLTSVDIRGLYSKVASGNVTLKIETAEPANPESFVSEILLDTDQSSTTGWQASLYGCEYAVIIAPSPDLPAGMAAVLRLSDSATAGTIPVTFSDNAVTVDIPLGLIGDDGLIDITAIAGTASEKGMVFSDIAPNPVWATCGNPPPPPPPVKSHWVEVTNVRDTSFTVSWVTTAPCASGIVYGDNQSSLSSNVSDNRSSYLHYFTLSNLTPGKTYYFDLLYGANTDNNSGAHYSVTTGPTLDIPSTDDIVGRVFKSDNTTPAEGVIVYLTLSNGISSSENLSILTGTGGYWLYNIGSARTQDFQQYFAYSSDNTVSLFAEGAVDGRAVATCNVSVARVEAPRLILRPNRPPVISNLMASQQAGSGEVAIGYNVSDPEQTEVKVSFQFWNGTTWVDCATTTGEDVVTTGTGKTGTWDARADYNGHYLTSRIKVVAKDIFPFGASGEGVSDNFTLDTLAPQGAGCSSPVNNAVDVTLTPLLVASVATDNSSPLSYWFKLSDNQDSGWLSTNTWTPPEKLDADSPYTWQVKVKDSFGNESAWSQAYSFRTMAIMSYSLNAGLNLWALAGEPADSYTASSLAELINNQVDPSDNTVSKVFRWYAGGWQGYRVGIPPNDFAIEHDRGYFILSDNVGDFDMVSSGFKAPINIYVPTLTRVNDVRFTVTWGSQNAEEGYIEYGTTTALGTFAHDDRGAGVLGNTHYCTAMNLLPGTTYYYDIIRGGVRDNNGGAHYTVATMESHDPYGPDSIVGRVMQSDNATGADGAVVLCRVVGENSTSAWLSGLGQSGGYFEVDLNDLRIGGYSFSDTSNAEVVVEGVGDGRAEFTSTIGELKAGLRQVRLGYMVEEGFNAGLNLWALSGKPADNYTASSLAELINTQFGPSDNTVTKVFRWHAGGWEGYRVGIPLNDFAIEPGNGYFVLCNNPSTWKMPVKP